MDNTDVLTVVMENKTNAEFILQNGPGSLFKTPVILLQ